MDKESIFDTAVALFRHQGIRATRMDDVAEIAIHFYSLHF